jgi:hypothetical protein
LSNQPKPNEAKTHQNKPFAAFLRRKKNPTQTLKQKSKPKHNLQKKRGGITSSEQDRHKQKTTHAKTA